MRLRLSQIARQLSTSAANSRMTYPTTVKAVGIEKQGGVEEIKDLTVPFPQVKPNELLIKV
jgi:hypothetical protein